MHRTYQPNKRKRLKKHGFLSRTATNKRNKVIKKRTKKGRWKKTVSDEK